MRLLLQYRVLAFTTAILLIVLVFVGLPLQLAAGEPGVVNVVGTGHGILYVAYLVVAFRLTRRLGVPKWQMLLVLLAGTVPFCAFVAERKMTRRFESLTHAASGAAEGGDRAPTGTPGRCPTSWWSRRAVVLHVEVLLVVPACGLAGWWQATRALSGNGLSWVYSVEWPLFGLIAIWGWWQLVHEDPEAFEARKARGRARDDRSALVGAPSQGRVDADAATARLSSLLAVFVTAEFLIGVITVVTVPFSRPAGWLPTAGRGIYLAHSALGVILTVAAVAFVVRASSAGRTPLIVAWTGLAGVGIAGAGGLLAAEPETIRFLGMALMFIGPGFAGCIYLIPALARSSERRAAARTVAAGES